MDVIWISASGLAILVLFLGFSNIIKLSDRKWQNSHEHRLMTDKDYADAWEELDEYQVRD